MGTILAFLTIAAALVFGGLIHFYGTAGALWILYGAFFILLGWPARRQGPRR